MKKLAIGLFALFVLLVSVVLSLPDFESQRTVESQEMNRADSIQSIAQQMEFKAIQHIKKEMHNPSSFELADAKTSYNENKVFYELTYRGTNVFNAIVTHSVNLSANLDGTDFKIVN